ncbi:LRR receptor-like serine threonine-protein kinase [Seminavis robusta]|uniref:LRR receptor-like serine threonine-protein kinase n=1 Tax=Seminavis robusta TaxID=568900 RepID=A0A9N8HA75_9STRA|nr:LRR receptor-like serine threonine-protein kinase [Seminavis robusta]|eukprot:Sro308_g113590.1 LRR receptor-like serine threonine-protein kinase (782) ;mRNA; r:41543-44037
MEEPTKNARLMTKEEDETDVPKDMAKGGSKDGLEEVAQATESRLRQAKEFESPLSQAMNVALSTDDYDPINGILEVTPGSHIMANLTDNAEILDGVLPMPSLRPIHQQFSSMGPGAFSATPGMELERVETISHSLVGAPPSREFAATREDHDDDEELACHPYPKNHAVQPEDSPINNDDEVSPASMDRGLAVANPVEEALPHHLLPQAQNVDAEQETARTRVQRTKQIKTYLLLAAILLIAIIMILVAVLVPENNQDLEEPTLSGVESPKTEPPTTSPTILSIAWDGLPMSTLNALKDPSSPQARAYDWLLNDPNGTAYPQWRIQQRFALAVFYFSTGGEDWILQEDWLSYDVDECSWYVRKLVGGEEDFFLFEGNTEVTAELQYLDSVCDDDGQYLHLVFTENNMEGTLPPEISLLSNSLVNLEVGSNENLYGVIPSEIGLLTNLLRFYADRSLHSGQIPTEIGKLSLLQELELGHNPLTGSIPSEIGNMGALSFLSLVYCVGLSGAFPTEIYRLTNMVTLRAQALKGLTGGDLLPEIGQMTKLKEFLTAYVPFNGSIPTEIGMLSNLSKLNLYECHITGSLPTELFLLTNMVRLDLDVNEMTGTLPTDFGLLSNLSMFVMHGNSFTGTLPASIFESWGQLTFLTMNHNNLEGPLPTELGLLTSMEKMWLNHNRFSGSIPSELGLLSKVTDLRLGDTNLTGSIPEALSDLDGLELLTVSNTSLTGSIPGSLCDRLWDMIYTCNTYYGLYTFCYDVEKVNFTCSSTNLCGCDACEMCNTTG